MTDPFVQVLANYLDELSDVIAATPSWPRDGDVGILEDAAETLRANYSENVTPSLLEVDDPNGARDYGEAPQDDRGDRRGGPGDHGVRARAATPGGEVPQLSDNRQESAAVPALSRADKRANQ